MKSIAVSLLSCCLIPLGGLSMMHGRATQSHTLSVVTATPVSIPPSPYPTPLPAEVSQVTVALLHVVHHRWKATTHIHLGERARFAMAWATDSGSLFTPAAASLTVYRRERIIYQAFRGDSAVRPGGSFQWTGRFRDPHFVGHLQAWFSMRVNNDATGSLPFILKS